MPILTTADLKRHLNIEAADTSDDTLLAQKIAAAEATIGDAIGRPLEEYLTDETYANTVPAPLLEAVRQLVAHWFEQREAVVIGNGMSAEATPWSVVDLIQPYRRWVF